MQTTMKKNCILGAALSFMAAAFMLSSCAKEDIIPEVTEGSEATTSVTIPFTVTVNGEPETRTTVDGDMKTLRFSEGDKLYIAGVCLQGVLDIQSGVGETSGATFSGQLTYHGNGPFEEGNFLMFATLVGAHQEVTLDEYGFASVNYSNNEYCATLEEAVQRYSMLTGWSDTKRRSFTLTQSTTFLNFDITFEDGTPAGTEISAAVTTNRNNAPYCTANVTTRDEDGKVVARFVLPKAAGYALNDASVKLGVRDAIPFGTSGMKLGGKVYNVKMTAEFAGPMSEEPLTVRALTTGTVRVVISGRLSTGMKYSVNGGEKNLISYSTHIPVSAGDLVRFYGNGTSTQVYGNQPCVKILSDGEGFTCKAFGNVMSLLDEEGFATKTDLPDMEKVFSFLFSGNTALIDAGNLCLPATTLAKDCYSFMFRGCTALTKAPELPATTLAQGCYANMFYDCTALTAAPALPAMTMAQDCYWDMFSYCSSLTAAPALPATTLAQGCYRSMFSNCTALTTAPDLPAATLVSGCYHYMFYGCSSLNSLKCLATSEISSSSTYNWLNKVASTGTFYLASAVIWPKSESGIPIGWTGKYPDGKIWTLPHPLAEVNANDIGKVVGANGIIYDTKAVATYAGTTPVAMVAYVGTASNCKHGLALALEEEAGMKNWYDARTVCAGKTPVPGGTWRLPSDADWQYMFIGCGSGESYSYPFATRKDYGPLSMKIGDVTGKNLAGCAYWTSSDYREVKSFYANLYVYATFHDEERSVLHNVRAVLAF